MQGNAHQLYCCETWYLRADHTTEAAEMQFLRWVIGYTLSDQRWRYHEVLKSMQDL